MSAVAWQRNQITIATTISSYGEVKTTKTRRSRTFHIGAETVAMLKRHRDQMDERASAAAVDLMADAYLFSLAQDCSTPMPPDYLTKRVGVLKGHVLSRYRRHGAKRSVGTARRGGHRIAGACPGIRPRGARLRRFDPCPAQVHSLRALGPGSTSACSPNSQDTIPRF